MDGTDEAWPLHHIPAQQEPPPIVSTVASDHVELRTAFCASQPIGLGMMRYVLRLE